MASLATGREFDLILWGVTGFTGKLVATTFARRYGLRNSNIRIALAGRTLSRLEDVAQLMLHEALESNDPRVKDEAKKVQIAVDKAEPILPIIQIKNIEAGAKSLCERTHVIIALAGPFTEVGEPVVKAAAECGTDYVDITGEIDWFKLMRKKYDIGAKSTKARIIPCCGFDFLLNDVGLFCIQYLASRIPNCIMPVQRVDQLCRVKGSKISGGTARTMLGKISNIPITKICRGTSPFEYCDDQDISREIIKKNANIYFSHFSDLSEQWMAPSLMTLMMKKYVFWTNEINGFPHGKDFIFKVGEKTAGFCSSLFKSFSFIFSLFALVLFSRSGPLVQKLTPASGEGRPTSELESRENFVEFQTIGIVNKMNSLPIKIHHTITFPHGEAYIMTAWGVLECGITCLKIRREEYPSTNQYGVGCPSQLLGHSVVDQLKLAGFNFDYKETQLIS